MKLKKSGTVYYEEGTNFKFDTRKASKEFKMAYGLAKAAKDAGYSDILMTLSWDMVGKVTPEGLVPIINMGILMHNSNTDYCIALDADTKTGEHLTVVHDEKNQSYRVSMKNGAIQKPLLLMVKENDIKDCVQELMDASRHYHHQKATAITE